MKNAGYGALFVAILMLSNVVAAGVFAVLGPLALELDDDLWQLVAMASVGVLAVFCALTFLRGAVFFTMEFMAGPREDRIPNKGLQSAAGQRGG